MYKRILALLCAMALMVGMYVMPASAADAGENDIYEVGYAKRDINPWIELTIDADGTKIGIPAMGKDEAGNPIPYTDAETNIVKTKIHNPLNPSEIIEVPIVSLPMGGYGNQEERHVTCLTDDNGDGFITYGDGVYFTCTSVTDSYGKTVMYMTVDVTSIGDGTVSAVRKAIIEKLGSDVISEDEIMINANHSHSSMSFTAGTEGSAYEAYYNYMINQAAEAAVEAYNTRSQATMSKGSIESSEGMEALGYGEGVVMNTVRHRYTLGDIQRRAYKSNGDPYWNHLNGTDSANWVELIRTPHSGGTCFPSSGDIDYKSYVEPSDKGSVSPVDETLHVLRFDRDKGNPVVMINWRGHSTRNGGGGSNKNLSGDYANNLRYRLENNTKFGGTEDFCVAFWQGASGNVNTGGHGNLWYDNIIENEIVADKSTQDEVKVPFADVEYIYNSDGSVKSIPSVEYPDDEFYNTYYQSFGSIKENDKKEKYFAYNYDNRFYYCAKYGYLLAKIALVCMQDESKMEKCQTGRIQTSQVIYQAPRQQYTYGQYLAAKEWDENGRPDGNTVFPYWYDADLLDANGNRGEDGVLERYILNSDFHAKNVLNRYKYCDPDTDGRNLIPADEQIKPLVELNAIKMGENVAIVTIPGEPFDRYSSEATLETARLYNDWDNLITEDYGTPFVMGYSNASMGYMPNALAYDYLKELRKPLESAEDTFNKDEYYKLYYNVYDPGSYESNTSYYARGTGEKVVAQLDSMLRTMDDSELVTKYCTVCKDTFSWKPLNAENIASGIYESGHYYLETDFTTKSVPVKTINGDMKVCLDLNGKHYTSNGRIFDLRDNGVLNIMDSGDGGTLTAKSGSLKGVEDRYIGGMVYMTNSSRLYIYGGKLEFIRDRDYLDYLEALDKSTYEISGGGVINATSTSRIYLYDGTIQGGEMANSKYTNDGATIRAFSSSALYAYGGEIKAGTAIDFTKADGTVDEGLGDCVYAATSAKIYISGNAKIDEVYSVASNATKLTVTGPYTGEVNVKYGPSVTLTSNLDVGNVSKITQLTPGTLNCLNVGYQFGVDGSNLRIYDFDAVAAIGTRHYDNLEEAIAEYSLENGAIKLLDDVESVTVDKPVAIDLNGCDIEKLVTTGNGIVYGLDSWTDDYQIEGDAESGYTGYGKIKDTTDAKVDGVRLEDGIVADNYLMVTEADGVSFHRVTLQISSMVLRAKNEDEEAYNPSLYYKSKFAGDALVANNVKRFGIALSTKEEPNANNMGITNKYSQFDGSMFQVGENNGDTTSTLLYGIMKETNVRLTNQVNAKIMVHGRPYVQTTKGEYLFGSTEQRTLKEQVELADAGWSKYSADQKASMVQMYKIYKEVMADWTIPTIKKNAKAS